MTLLDGEGNTHPRGVGLAAHLGAELDLSTIGYVTSRLWGREILSPSVGG